jgi:hypothetical protein
LGQWLIELDKGRSKPRISAARRQEELGQVWDWLTNKALITTKAGRLGLGMLEARKGDQVAIIQGCNVPLLLRPSGRGLRLVGACYIDGLMDGEALRDPQNVRKLGKVCIS